MKWRSRHRPAHAARRLFVLILLLAAAIPAPTADARLEIAVGGTLHDVTLQGLNGPSRKLSAYLGRPLIINVWASWCAPCREEMQSLERLAWGDHRREFAIIGISTDDYPEKALSLLDVTHATISQFIDTDLQMENMLGASRLPLTVLVGADGRVLQKIVGARTWDGPEALRLIAQTFRDGH
ncbi:MAG: TlpA family protein disulfide reductase [Nevskiales bacterium]